jgi:hypothetical protein
MKVCNHTSRNRKFMRRENKFICPTIKGFNVPCEETELSTARIDVVPTVQIRFSLLLHHLQYHRLLE